MAIDTSGETNENFTVEELSAPFVIEKDRDYYSDLREKYKLLIKKAREWGADKESIDILNNYAMDVLYSIRKYYDGDIVSAQNRIQELIKSCIDTPLSINNVFSINLYPIQGAEGLPFFRARTSDKFQDFSPKEMLALPKSLRGKTGSYRFSIPGLPCLYLSNTSYGCWLETGNPAEHEFNVSPVLIDDKLKLFNLAVMTGNLSLLQDSDKDMVHCWLKLITLVIATSYVIKEENRTFKSEYIVSQLIMLSCKKLGLDGVAYYSKRVSDEVFARCAMNLALFAPYDKGEYSSLCDKIQINSSYNYSLFNQLSSMSKKVYGGLVVVFDSHGEITNFGNFLNQNSYTGTSFHEFDMYLLKSWKERKVASSFFDVDEI